MHNSTTVEKGGLPLASCVVPVMQNNPIMVMPDDEELLEEQEYINDDPRERPQFGVEECGDGN